MCIFFAFVAWETSNFIDSPAMQGLAYFVEFLIVAYLAIKLPE